MKKKIAFLFWAFLPFFCFAQQNKLYVLNLEQPQNQYLNPNYAPLSKTILLLAKQNSLSIFLATRNAQPQFLDSAALAKRFVSNTYTNTTDSTATEEVNKETTNDTAQLTYIGIETIGIENTIKISTEISTTQNSNLLPIKALHFFRDKESAEMGELSANFWESPLYLFSIDFAVFCAAYQKLQTPKAVWHTAQATNILGFGAVLRLEKEQELIEYLATAANQNKLVPFYAEKNNKLIKKDLSDTNGATIRKVSDKWRESMYKELQEIVENRANKNYTIRLKEKARVKKYLSDTLKVSDKWSESGVYPEFYPTELQIFDDGNADNSYAATYCCSFDFQDFLNLQDCKNWLTTNCPEWTAYSLPTALQKQLWKASQVIELDKTENTQIVDYQAIICEKKLQNNHSLSQIFVKDIDLRAVENLALQRKNKEISRLFLKALFKNKIKAYQVALVGLQMQETALSLGEVLANLRMETAQSFATPIQDLANEEITVNLQAKHQQTPISKPDKLYRSLPDSLQANYHRPPSLYRLQVLTQAYFSTQGEQKTYQLHYIALVLPAVFSAKGIDEVVAYFRAEDCQKIIDKTRKARFKNSQTNKRSNYFEALQNQQLQGSFWEATPVFEN